MSHLFLDDVYRPQMTTIEEESDTLTKSSSTWVQIITPSSGAWFMNTVKHAQLSPTDALTAIDKTVAEYKQHGVNSFTWIVGPRSTPTNLGELLLSKGFVRDCKTIGMGLSTSDLVLHENSGFVIEELSAKNFEDMLRLNREVWHATDEDCEYMRRNRDASLSRSKQGIRTLICYKDGEPVGSAAYAVYENLSLHLIGGGVHPSARSIGVYRAMVEYRMKLAAQFGIPVVTVHCLENTSAPICMHFGFQPVCEFVSFTFGA